jgi:hypothetical protein
MSGQVRLGRNTRAVAVQTMRSMLFASPARAAGNAPVAVVYDGGAESRAALALAAQFSVRDGNRLSSSLRPRGWSSRGMRPPCASRPGAWASPRRSGAFVAGIFRISSAPFRSEPAELLIVGAQVLASGAGDSLDLVVEKSTCSVLLVRG